MVLIKRIALLLAASAASLLLLAGCSRSVPKKADLDGTMDAMKQKINSAQMTDLSEDDLMPNYGIKAADVRQFAACIDSTGTKGDEILLFEGTGNESAERIAEKLNARLRQKAIEMKDYLPEEYAMLKKCGVERSGNYVALIVSPRAGELKQIYKNAMKQ